MTRRTIGLAYAITTAALLGTFVISGRCWGAQNLPGGSMPLHDACLAVWAVSGLLLALSQIVFLVIALAMKPTDSSPAPRGLDPIKLLIGLIAGAILLAIAIFVFALSQMPS